MIQVSFPLQWKYLGIFWWFDVQILKIFFYFMWFLNTFPMKIFPNLDYMAIKIIFLQVWSVGVIMLWRIYFGSWKFLDKLLQCQFFDPIVEILYIVVLKDHLQYEQASPKWKIFKPPKALPTKTTHTWTSHC